MNSKIRDLREDRDLTQQAVARLLLCDQSLYSKYERGERELPLRLAVRLAQYYGVSVDYLVGLTDQRRPYPRGRAR
jgi:transcriptional regulator with XRE-family HTH domain